MMATLVAADDLRFLAVVKTLVLNPDSPKHGLQSINALVTLLDSRTGLPLTIIDAIG